MNLREELNKLDLQPLGSRIIVKEKKVEKIGRIIVPLAVDGKETSVQPTEGMILAVGEHVEDVKPGDHVYYGRYSGVKIQRGNAEFSLMNDEDVLARVKNGGGGDNA